MLLEDQIGFESAMKKIEAWMMFPLSEDCSRTILSDSTNSIMKQFKPTNQYEKILITRMIMEEEYEHGNSKPTKENSRTR